MKSFDYYLTESTQENPFKFMPDTVDKNALRQGFIDVFKAGMYHKDLRSRPELNKALVSRPDVDVAGNKKSAEIYAKIPAPGIHGSLVKGGVYDLQGSVFVNSPTSMVVDLHLFWIYKSGDRGSASIGSVYVEWDDKTNKFIATRFKED